MTHYDAWRDMFADMKLDILTLREEIGELRRMSTPVDEGDGYECDECGNALDTTWAFCPGCGHLLDWRNAEEGGGK